MTLVDLLNRVAEQLPGCKSTSIVSLHSGLALASVAPGDADAAAGADAFTSDLYRLTANAMQELGSQDSVDNIVIEGKQATFVSTPLGDGEHFWHVVTAHDTTLGFTQAVMRKHRDDIEQSISALLGD